MIFAFSGSEYFSLAREGDRVIAVFAIIAYAAACLGGVPLAVTVATEIDYVHECFDSIHVREHVGELDAVLGVVVRKLWEGAADVGDYVVVDLSGKHCGGNTSRVLIQEDNDNNNIN